MKLGWMQGLMVLGILTATEAKALPIAVPPVQISITPEQLFLPQGFDSNDMAQAVVAGDLGDTCVKVSKLQARVDEERKRIILRQEAWQHLECWCTKLSVPYHQVVDLGILSPGRYAMEIEGAGPKPSGVLMISPAVTSAPDDHLYAPVEEALVDVSESSASLTLRGIFPNRCMSMREVRVSAVADNVIEVLPIADLREGADCEGGRSPFEARIDLPRSPGKTLVHIRALNGRSINKIVSLP